MARGLWRVGYVSTGVSLPKTGLGWSSVAREASRVARGPLDGRERLQELAGGAVAPHGAADAGRIGGTEGSGECLGDLGARRHPEVIGETGTGTARGDRLRSPSPPTPHRDVRVSNGS